MTPLGLALLAAAAGAVGGAIVGWRWRGRRHEVGTPAGGTVTPHLLPEPALAWLRRATGAHAVFAVEAGRDGRGGREYQAVDPAWPGGEAELALIATRLRAASEREGDGAERMEAGFLLTASSGGTAVAVLLPASASPALRAAARSDLLALLEGVARRPVLHDLAQVQEGTVGESVESVAMRLAYQVERIAGAEAYVGVTEPAGVRVVGVSGLADRRALGQVLPREAPLSLAGRGLEGEGSATDPLGLTEADRRRHPPARVVPIAAQGKPLGALAWRMPDGRTAAPDADREIREALRAAAPRFESARQLAEATDTAVRDPLTGLFNRRGLADRMGLLGPERAALVSLDLDRFKLLNDTLGHAAGDAALVHLARILLDQVRGMDVVARVGGEEFLLWLPGTTLEEGARVAERVRVRLGTGKWDWQGRAWPLSASFGVAAWPETTRSRENLAAQADAALYAAKRGGRDRVVPWSNAVGKPPEGMERPPGPV